MSATSVDVADGIPMPQRIWAVVAVSAGAIFATLDASIANVALPSIATDLGASAAATVWVVNAYQLTVAVLLLALSSAAEIIGLRRIFWSGLLVFTLASGACGLAPTLPWLIGARVVQGLGAAAIFAVYPALVAHAYPRRMLGRGIGISATVLALASAAGPAVAGAILAAASWPWLFLVNLPIGAAGLLIGLWALPRPPATPRRFDLAAALLNGVMISLLVTGIDGLGRAATRGRSALAVVAALVLGTWLFRREARRATPLVPVDLLRLPIFALSVGTSMCSYAAQVSVLIGLPFLFQQGLGWSAAATGLLMTPIPLAVAAVGGMAGRLADSYPAGILCGIGLLLMAAGAAALGVLPPAPSVLDVIWREVLVGFGFGLFQAPNNRLLLSAGPRHRAASAGGVLATARVLGQSFGAAIVAAIFELVGGKTGLPVLATACAIALLGAATSFLRLALPKSA
jgi:DHA2 family multidrug resistance protein-like MFS transporter